MEGIQVKDLKKIYGKNDSQISALNGISFNVQAGEFLVILGHSGSGKSTLLNILGGMDSCTSGQVMVENTEISALSESRLAKYRRNDIGFVFQFYNLMPNLTALENVQLAEGDSGIKAADALALVGLNKRFNNFPSQLSGGEQQRVSIARAIVKSPKLLLCDEPTGALDSNTGKTIIELLMNLAREHKQTVIVVTHNTQFSSLAPRIIRLSDGLIIEDRIQEPADIKEICL